ncbi:hypothetical protein FKW77_009980 [Venturia effusa]|uniref:Uncharacterized protein n=1 Tax=Venturia effusa TaxID=50376 RepID=A0A517L685_9PEZI|nr:hypothetical protein FKW77_009980 [Venturia effusa]
MVRLLRIVRTWIPLLWTILALILVLVIAIPRKRASGNITVLGSLARIDASQVITETGTGRYQGLPDSHDFSKHKDFFILYLSGYCSGKKVGDEYKSDSCSRPGQMFDQYNVWKTWGVNLAETRNSARGIQRAIGVTAIKTMPGAIFITMKLLVVAFALTTLVGIISPFSHWAKVLVTILSTISSLSAFTVASMCESLYPTLAKRVDNYHPTAKGVMTSHVGRNTLTSLWIVSVLSLLATLFWIIDAVRRRERAVSRTGTAKGGASMYEVPKIVRRATGGLLGGNNRYENTSYDTLRPAPREPSRDPSRSESQEELTGKVIHRRMHSCEPSVGRSRMVSDESTVLHDSEDILDEKSMPQSRYEPFRHRDLP